MKKITFPHRKKSRTRQWVTLLYCLGMGVFLHAYSGPGTPHPEKNTADAGSLAYCTPAATETTYFIKDFITTGGSVNIMNTNSGIGPAGYSDNSSVPVRQTAGGVISFTAAYSTGTYGLAIWVDWNGNTTFEAGERMYNTAYLSSVSGSFTVPAATPIGSYRMRVLADYNKENPVNSCAFNSGKGEAEDYTLEVGDPPSCMAPTELGAGNVTFTSAQLSWLGEGTIFDVEYGPAGFTRGTGTMASSIGNPYDASGLTPDTAYQFYVRRDCGAGDKSTWTGPFRFFTGYCTPSATSTTYFVKNFSTTGGFTNISNMNTGIGSGGYSNYAAMKVSQFEGGSVSFSAAYSIGSGFAIWVDWNRNMAFETGERVFNTTSYGAAATGSITVPAGTPVGNYRMRIRMDYNNTNPSDACTFTSGNGEAEDYTFEVVTPPSCLPPTELGAGNITFTSAQLSWLGEGTVFDVEYGPAGFTRGTGTMASSVRNPYDASGLTPDTSYQFYVRRDCGAGDKSPWAGPYRFFAGYCLPAATSTSYFIKDFSTTGGLANISNIGTSIGTGGYSSYTAMKVSQFETGTVNFSAAYSVGSGFAIWVDWNRNMAFDSGERMFNTTSFGAAATGTFSVPAGTPVGNYRMRLRMDYNTNNPSDACGFNSGNGEAEDYTFEVVTPPSCMPPTELGAGNITFTGAQLSWLGEGTIFDVEYGPAGFAQGTGTMASSVANPYNVTALTPDTAYQFYVRRDCGAGSKSPWAGPFRFFTGYCIPSTTSTYYSIKDFTTTGGFTNISNTNSGLGTAGYSNHAAMKVLQSEGGSVNFSAAYTSGCGFAIWVDWNRNMAFDTDERVFNTTSYGAAATGSFIVPAGTPLGSYRMRVMTDSSSNNPTMPCASRTGGETEDYTLEVATPPTCMPPTELAAGNIAYTTAQLSWLGEGTVFDVEYGPAGFARGTGTMASSVANPYNVAGLTADTAYQFYVRRDCGAGDKSPWAGPFRFFTGPCRPAVTSMTYFVKDFATTGGFININNTGTGFGTGGYSNFATMKVQQFPGGVVSFSAVCSISSGFSIWVDWNSNMAFEASERVFNTTAYGTTATGTITVPAGTALGSYRMRIMMDNNTGNPNNPCAFVVYEDEWEGGTYSGGEAEDYTFEVTTPPSCMPPTELGAGNITFTSAQLSWLGEGTVFDVEYGPAGFAQGTGTMVSSTGNPYDVTGLTPETAYQFYVRRDCGAGDRSPWAGPFRFFTGYCMPAGTGTGNNFIKDFITTGSSVNISNTNTGRGTGGYSNYAAMKVQRFEGGSVSFSAAYNTGTFGLAIWIDWNNNMSFEAGERMFNTTGFATSASGTITVPTGTPIGNYRMRVLADYNKGNPDNPCGFNSGNGEAEDYTFEVVPTPSCVPPIEPIANMTPTTAQLSWTSDGNLFDLEYGPAGFAQGTGTMAAGTARPYNISGLTAETAYQFYVRKDCGVDGKSQWAGPFRFFTGYCTPAATSTSYFINSFTTAGGSANIINTGTTIGTGGYSSYTAMKVSQFAGGSVSFSAAYSTGCGFAIWVDWNNSMTFEASERVFNTTAYGAAATGGFAVPAGTPVGNYRMRIRTDYNNTSPSDACGFNLGNGEAEDYTFEVTTPPSCVPPSSLTIGSTTDTTAQLSWTSDGTLFDVEYGPAGFVQGTGTMAASVGNPYNATGLSGDTSYQFYVRRDCGAGGKSQWAGPFRFFGYCMPAATGTSNFIKDFSTAGGSVNIINMETGLGTGGYSNYAAIKASQSAGGSVSFNAAYSPGTFGLAIWIDWNKNMIFEAGERIFNTTAFATSASGTIAVPAGTPIGNYRMRVLADFNKTDPDNPCGFNSGNGEAEDYTFEVTPPLSAPDFEISDLRVYPNPVKDMLHLSYTKDITDVAVFNLIGQQVIAKSINADRGQIDLSALPSGTYLVKVTADNAVKTVKIIKK